MISTFTFLTPKGNKTFLISDIEKIAIEGFPTIYSVMATIEGGDIHEGYQFIGKKEDLTDIEFTQKHYADEIDFREWKF